MQRSISISIRVSEDELKKIKLASELLQYSSHSEFIRRTVRLESAKAIKKNKHLPTAGDSH